MREEEDIDAELPPPDAQSFLLHLYFAYVHPFFPIIHKQDFLHSYNATCVCHGYNPASNLTLLIPMVSVIKRPQCTTCASGADVHEPSSHAATLQDVVALYVRSCCKILGATGGPPSARRSLCDSWTAVCSRCPSLSRLAHV